LYKFSNILNNVQHQFYSRHPAAECCCIKIAKVELFGMMEAKRGERKMGGESL
jgi:hypothetical protein